MQVLNNKNGFLLLTSLIILLFLSVMGLSLTNFILSSSLNINMEVDRQKALYLTEAGIAKAINEMRLDEDLDRNGLGNIKPTRLGDGVYSATHDAQSATITGTGEVNDISRRIQIKYSSL